MSALLVAPATAVPVKGGMGAVYLAEDATLGRRVALKMLAPEMAADPDRLARFQREAKTVAALNHPNIVTIYSVEDADGERFITMELVEGRCLDELIDRRGMPLKEFFDIALPLAEALSAAHDGGVTHRDLKPANVMVTGEGRVKVLDFGLAKLQAESLQSGDGDPTQALTQEGTVMGTVPYMSPEQVQSKAIDHRSDIFSLGVLYYEMATGERPFRGDTSADLISSILRDSPRSVTDVKLELPDHLGRIIRRCLEKNPSKRYQSALELRNDLEVGKAAVIDPDNASVQYNLACTYALLGEIEHGIDSLEQSITSGMGQKEWIENDPDLDALRDHPRFVKLLESLSSQS